MNILNKFSVIFKSYVMRTYAPFSQSGILIRILALTLFIIIGMMFMGIFMISLPGGLTPDETRDVSVFNLKALQLGQTIFIFIFPAFVMAWLVSTKPMKYLGLKKIPNLKEIFLMTASLIAAIPFMNLIIQLNEAVVFPESLAWLENWFRENEDNALRVTDLILTADNWWQIVFNFFLISVMAGLSEEIFFRGILQNIIRDRWKRIGLAVWVAAFIFSAIHFQFYGFIPRLILGAYFGYLLVWSKSLWLPILAHMLNNGFAIVEYYLKEDGQTTLISDYASDLSNPLTYIYAFFSLCIFVLLTRYLYRICKKAG